MIQPIAVVIPFYKITFLKTLMEALAGQTDKAFTLYVGNDASTTEAATVADKFKDRLDIRYHRFEERMGHRDLAAQWNRCVDLIDGEDWLWTVPDDDVPSPGCIAAIRASADLADLAGANVIHIPCVTIDREGRWQNEPGTWQTVTGSAEFYLGQLKGEFPGMSLANVAYRRSAFERAGGFMSLPKAWGSDHATMLAVADGGPVVTAQDAWLAFRMSGENISSNNDDGAEKLQARIAFARWLAAKMPKWYDQDTAREVLRWFYFKSEHYVTRVWPFSSAMAVGLFELGGICGFRRTSLQRFKVYARGWGNVVNCRLRT